MPGYDARRRTHFRRNGTGTPMCGQPCGPEKLTASAPTCQHCAAAIRAESRARREILSVLDQAQVAAYMDFLRGRA